MDKENLSLEFESLLMQAGQEAFRRRIAALPAEETLCAQYGGFSALDQRIHDTWARICKQQDKTLPHVPWRVLKRIALVAALLAALFIGTLSVSAELRATLKNVLVQWNERNMDIRYEIEGRPLDALPEGYGPHYIPEGFIFAEESSYEDTGAFQKFYRDQDGYHMMISVRIAENASLVSTDSEHTNYEKIDYGEGDAYLGTFENGDGYVMYWYAEGIEHELYINAYLTREEVFMIADNIY